MKVLMVNGSPRQNGNTARALKDNPPPAREPWQMTSFMR